MNLRELALKANLFYTAAALLLALAIYSFLQAVVDGLIAPVIAAILEEPGLYALSFSVGNTEFGYGIVLTNLILLVVAVALVVFLAFALRTVHPDANRAVEAEAGSPAP